MNRKSLLDIQLWALVLAVAWPCGTASAQITSARRLAMGGVVLAGGQGSGGINVAYRVVPPRPEAGGGLPLPIGLVPFLADPPVFDPDDPDFNLYELANVLYNPPWNLQLGESSGPSNDITIAVGRDRLAVDLGDVAEVFPEESSRIGSVSGAPAISVGFGPMFVGVAPLVHFENDLKLNDALRGALRDGEPFRPRTEYALFDVGRAQVAAGAHFGWAGVIAGRGDPRADGMGLYAGGRVKLLRGLLYGDADNTVTFTTLDTLFGTDPVDIRYVGLLRDAGPEGGRFGRGLDLGIVWLLRGLELGVGVNNIATRVGWRVREHVAFNDSATGDYVDRIVREGARFTSEVPTTVTVNAAKQLGPVLVAADVSRGIHQTVGHLGAEIWTGRFAWRAGLSTDASEQVQGAAGLGVRLGRVGLDLALASHSRNVVRSRELELGAGLAFYREGRP